MVNESLFSYVRRLGAEIGSLYQDSRSDRTNILTFMDANGWFGLPRAGTDRNPRMRISDLIVINDSLTLWLSAYKQQGREKIKLMLERFDSTYPETCRLYKRFVDENQLDNEPAAWRLLDFILSEIDKEITLHDESDIKSLIGILDSEGARNIAKLFADFLNMESGDNKKLSSWMYKFNSRHNPELMTDAYPLPDFSIMAYCVFNEDMWHRQALMEKAISNKTFADLWLFVALHFICALRATDMARLPAPSLPYKGGIMLNKLSEGTFLKHEASALSEDLHCRLNLKPLYPMKTSGHTRIPEIKLFIPESLIVPLGYILAVALAHRPFHRPGDRFIQTSFRAVDIRRFFGKEFLQALGKQAFSTRRCNRSYLQGIDAVGGDTSGKPKGYMLTALARSHKSGIGKLADITEIYLKDASFSGYTPEFIVRQMFERGVFGFIPVALLEIYAGEGFTKLAVSDQTSLIRTLGLTALQIESVANVMERAMLSSRKAVAAIIKNPQDAKMSTGIMLQNIASGAASAKNQDSLCLMTAARLICPFPNRNGCFGCDYEIFTKAIMRTLMTEYTHIIGIKAGTEQKEARRYEMILEQAVLPAVAQILSSVKMLYPTADTGALLDIVEGELDVSVCTAGIR